MNLLILGGTVFVGRSLVDTALERGHHVTLFNRGRHGADLYPQVEQLRGDRDGDLAALQDRRWDAVIDTSGYVPRVVGASAALLAGSVDHYTFISSISAYAVTDRIGMDESGPLATMDDETVEEVNGETYGPLKVLSEQAVEQHFPERALIIRPGLIVGPNDPTDRFTYWPHRVAQGGEVLAPGEPELPVQFIDVRDLGEWTVQMVEQRNTGTFNATGPEYTMTMARTLDACRRVTGSDAEFTWVPDEFLLEREVAPWSELPLWVTGSDEYQGFNTVDCGKAIAAGLRFRPIEQTARDTLEWDSQRPADHEWRAGLSPERERELLAAWHAARDA